MNRIREIDVLTWLKKKIGLAEDAGIKALADQIENVDGIETCKHGVISIPVKQIVGSVDRAHELNSSFRYRGRAITSRYHNINQAMRDGAPMKPIQVVKISGRDRCDSEFYVVDGHHRVANAKARGFDEINAQVTEIILPDETD